MSGGPIFKAHGMASELGQHDFGLVLEQSWDRGNFNAKVNRFLSWVSSDSRMVT